MLIASSEEYLRQASQEAPADPEMLKNADSSATLRGRVGLNRIMADAVYVYSQLALAQGYPEKALALGKRCMRLNYRAWAGLECHLLNTNKPVETNQIEQDHSGLTETVSVLTISNTRGPPIMSLTHELLTSLPFWPLVPAIYRGMTLLSRLFAHQGMFQETIYYMEQADKVLNAVKTIPWMVESLAMRGGYLARGGCLQKGQDILAQAQILSQQIDNSRVLVTLQYQLAVIRNLESEWDQEADAYSRAENLLKDLCENSFAECSEWLSPSLPSLEGKMTQLSLRDSQSPTAQTTKRPVRSLVKGCTKVQAKTSERFPTSSRGFTTQCSPLLRLRGDVLRQKAYSMLLQHKLGDAASLLAEAEELPKTHDGHMQQRLRGAKQLLLRALNDMSADPVFCVLPESTISFPAVATISRGKERQGGDRIPAKGYKASPPRTRTLKPGLRKIVRSRSPVIDDFVDILTQARDQLSEIQTRAIQTGSTNTLHLISNAFCTVLMLLSAACKTTGKIAINPYFVTYSTGMLDIFV